MQFLIGMAVMYFMIRSGALRMPVNVTTPIVTQVPAPSAPVSAQPPVLATKVANPFGLKGVFGQVVGSALRNPNQVAQMLIQAEKVQVF